MTSGGTEHQVHVPGWFYVRNWRLGEEYGIYDVDGDGACFYSAVAFLVHPRGAAGKMDIKNMTADSLGEADYAQKVQWETSETDAAFGVRSLETWKQAVRSAVAYEADYSTIMALGTTLASLYGIGLCIASTQTKGNLCHSNLSCPMTRTTHPLPCIDKFIFVYHTGRHYMALTVMDASGHEHRVVPLDMLLQYEKWTTNTDGDARPHNHERRLKELADHLQTHNCVESGVRGRKRGACTNTVTMQSLAANIVQLFSALAEK
ncbi:hypothetical protein GHT06_003779 [Daphnia sinensis]|uniref:OTU domain-containing protein n=1 Tax=Daphnia sinensis TaxID=1820382 RepID=A0AAD5KTR4_9CRUS|nr:hypothetical protein GHT06_003779 [Daphnia sinensis]